jgi:pSer/pThr/pTyr-binding forkhead associated (FHA) protein
MPTVFCTQCGHQNPDDARFCAHCGAAIVPPDATSTISLPGVESFAAEPADEEGQLSVDSAIEALPSGSAMLVVLRGPNAGSRFLLDRDVTTAGRHPESDIFLDDVTVSRRHAEFRRDGSTFTVCDVGSLNGTYLNRDRVEKAELASGDEVRIGKFRLVFYTGGPVR